MATIVAYECTFASARQRNLPYRDCKPDSSTNRPGYENKAEDTKVRDIPGRVCSENVVALVKWRSLKRFERERRGGEWPAGRVRTVFNESTDFVNIKLR